MVDLTKNVSPDPNIVVDSVVWTYGWASDSLSYGFTPQDIDGNGIADFEEGNWRGFYEAIFADVSTFTPLTFTETAADRSLLDQILLSGGGGQSADPGPGVTQTGTSVGIAGTASGASATVFLGQYSNVWLHEIGHSLGLRHTFEVPDMIDDDVAGASDLGDHFLNSALYSVMSYSDTVWGEDDPWTAAYDPGQTVLHADLGSYGPIDIAALQYIYGAKSYAAGDDVYRFGDDKVADRGYTTIWDTGGDDTIQYTGSSRSTIDLRAATLQKAIGGGGFLSTSEAMTGGFLIANGVTIENAIGGGYDDVITGNAAANTLTGQAGRDRLTGGAGADVFKDTGAGHDGDTITDFTGLDTIWVTDAQVAGFGDSYDPSTGRLTFRSGASAAVSLSLSPGLVGAFAATADPSGGVDITLDARPTFTGIGASAGTAGQDPGRLAAQARLADASLDRLNGGAGDYAGAVLTVGRTAGASAGDLFGFAAGPAFSASGGILSTAGRAFGSYTSGGGLLALSFTSTDTAATTALVDAVLAAITYAEMGDAPSSAVSLAYHYVGPSGAGFIADATTSLIVQGGPAETASGGVLATTTAETIPVSVAPAPVRHDTGSVVAVVAAASDGAVAAQGTSAAPSGTPGAAVSAGMSVTLDPTPTYIGDGAFVFAGRASGTFGVVEVTFSAVVDGAEESLGSASVASDGTFSFTDPVHGSQGFITATMTDGRANQAEATAPIDLATHGSGGRVTAEENSYDGDTLTSTSLYRADGSRRVDVLTSGQVWRSSSFDTFLNHGTPGNSFVFDPGFGADVVRQFHLGAGHDTLVLSGSDFDDSIANVLRNSHTSGNAVVIHDPTSGDTLRLTGIVKRDLWAHAGAVTFHT